jgi:type II secretory ATPase GspE/PulE/Tfp pilus assembly ATPase PilB-like protein
MAVSDTELKALIAKQLAEPTNKVSIIDLVDNIISYAYVTRTSDIHLDFAEERF